MSNDRALLEAIAQPLAEGNLPDPAHCEALADRLMLAGAGAAAARWRSWALLPPGTEQLLVGLGEATFVLCEPAEAGQVLWAPVLEALDRQAEPQQLDAVVEQALQGAGPLPQLEVAEGIVGRLEQAGAARAALRMLEPLWLEQRRFGLVAPALCNRMARLWLQLGDPVQAELRFQLSLEQAPEQPLAWFQLARLQLEQGQPHRALHSAEQGLQCHPGHIWGLKLRVRALEAMGGWASLEQLQRLGLWPDDDALCAGLARGLGAGRRWEQRRRHMEPQPGPGVGEALSILARSITERPGPLLLLFARSGAVVRWALGQGLWPADRLVLPVASRDPWRVRQDLEEAGASAADEQQLVEACRNVQPLVVVLGRPSTAALPLEIRPWLEDPSVAWVAPVGLLQPLRTPADWEGYGRMVWSSH